MAKGNVNWMFGRGLSISCGLSWTVPGDWGSFAREDKIRRIKEALRGEMAREELDCGLVGGFLDQLADRTHGGWRHRFLTTNWDFLLQREISRRAYRCQPPWMANSHVFHLNGTVEELGDDSQRSPFLLEEDTVSARHFTVEADLAYSAIIWDREFVVVGMSFECETDRFLLAALRRAEDDLPIGESNWLVVNPDPAALVESCARLRSALPRARIVEIQLPFHVWLDRGFPELASHGVLR